MGKRARQLIKSILNQRYFSRKIVAVGHVLFTCSKYSRSYFRLGSERSSSFNFCIHGTSHEGSFKSVLPTHHTHAHSQHTYKPHTSHTHTPQHNTHTTAQHTHHTTTTHTHTKKPNNCLSDTFTNTCTLRSLRPCYKQLMGVDM